MPPPVPRLRCTAFPPCSNSVGHCSATSAGDTSEGKATQRNATQRFSAPEKDKATRYDATSPPPGPHLIAFRNPDSFNSKTGAGPQKNKKEPYHIGTKSLHAPTQISSFLFRFCTPHGRNPALISFSFFFLPLFVCVFFSLLYIPKNKLIKPFCLV